MVAMYSLPSISVVPHSGIQPTLDGDIWKENQESPQNQNAPHRQQFTEHLHSIHTISTAFMLCKVV